MVELNKINTTKSKNSTIFTSLDNIEKLKDDVTAKMECFRNKLLPITSLEDVPQPAPSNKEEPIGTSDIGAKIRTTEFFLAKLLAELDGLEDTLDI